MGVLFSRLYNLYEYFGGSGRNSKIVMLGLDGAGKTTILYKVKLNETVTTIPTIGMNVETVSPSSGVTFTVWDMGGQDKIRCLWRRYFQCSEGIIFVVDSSDRERIQEVKEELFEMLKSESLSGVPVQIIANKQDLSNAMTPADVTDELQLTSLCGHKWHVQGACATTGDGVVEAFESMSCLVKDFNRTRPSH